jgi:hypothetical protein
MYSFFEDKGKEKTPHIERNAKESGFSFHFRAKSLAKLKIQYEAG